MKTTEELIFDSFRNEKFPISLVGIERLAEKIDERQVKLIGRTIQYATAKYIKWYTDRQDTRTGATVRKQIKNDLIKRLKIDV